MHQETGNFFQQRLFFASGGQKSRWQVIRVATLVRVPLGNPVSGQTHHDTGPHRAAVLESRIWRRRAFAGREFVSAAQINRHRGNYL